MTETVTENPSAEPGSSPGFMAAYVEDSRQQSPGKDASGNTAHSHTVHNHNTGKIQVINEGDVDKLNINLAEELLNIKSLLTGFDVGEIKMAGWERDGDGKDNPEYQSNLNRLLEDHIIFVSGNDKKDRWSLAYSISCSEALKDHEKKQIFFGHASQKVEFGLMELAQKMNESENLFVIGDLGVYNLVPCQRIFLDSLTRQLHHDSLKLIRDKKIYIVVLVTTKIGRNIALKQDGFEGHFHVWPIDSVVAEQAPDIGAIFENTGYIHKVLLYTATFFNGISFRNFDAIVRILLEGGNNNVPVAMKAYKDFDEGARKVLKVIDDDKVRIWNTYKDQLLEECCLTGKEEAGMYIVDFRHPELLERSRQHFKGSQHFFWQEQFFIIERSGLVFSRNDHVAERVIDIILEAIMDDPDYYDDKWFWRLAMDIRDFENEKIAIEGNTPEEQMYGLWELIRRRDDAYFFYNRFGQILAQMLTKGMGQRVKTFLDHLIREHDVLLKLTQRLSHLEAFDKFYWIKQLIDRGTIEIKNRTYRWLLNKVSYYDRARTWQAIISWLPQDRKIVNYSPSNHYACLFVIHFYVNEAIVLPTSSHGEWPNAYPLFAGYDEDPEKCREHMKFVLQQAFHEGTQSQFDPANLATLYWISEELFCLIYIREDLVKEIMDIDNAGINNALFPGYTASYQSLLADLVETWFHILNGYKEEEHKGSTELCPFMMTTVMEESRERPQGLDKMMRHWEKKHVVYRKHLDRIKKYQEDNGDDLDEDDIELMRLLTDSIHKRTESLNRFLQQLGTYLK